MALDFKSCKRPRLKVNEYDLETPQSKTADKPMAP